MLFSVIAVRYGFDANCKRPTFVFAEMQTATARSSHSCNQNVSHGRSAQRQTILCRGICDCSTHLARSALAQPFEVCERAEHRRDREAPAQALNDVISSRWLRKRQPPYPVSSYDERQSQRYRTLTRKSSLQAILQIKVADTRTNHTAGFCLVHATPGRAHTARMYILIIFVSVFLTGYTARM